MLPFATQPTLTRRLSARYRRKSFICSAVRQSTVIDESVAHRVRVELQCGNVAHGAAWHAGNGLFVTCYHLIANANSFTIAGQHARIQTICCTADIAVIACDAHAHMPKLDIRCTDDPLLDVCYASGAMLPAILLPPQPTILKAGASGMPIQRDGTVIAMFAGTTSDSVHTIPATLLRYVLNKQHTTNVRLGALPGLHTQPLILPNVRTAALVPHHVTGERVSSGGQPFGLQTGDIITAINNVPVNRTNPLSMHLAAHTPNSTTQLSIFRPSTAHHLQTRVQVHDARLCNKATPYTQSRLVVTSDGFVFIALSFQFLAMWGSNWYQSCPHQLLHTATSLPQLDSRGRPDQAVLLAVVPSGYESFANRIVDKVENHRIRRLLDIPRFSPAHGPTLTLRGGDVLSVGPCRVEEGAIGAPL